MKTESNKYIYVRVKKMFLLLFCFIFLLLLLLAYLTVKEQTMVWSVLLFTGVFSVLLYGIYLWIYKPYQETDKVLKLFSEGYWMEGIFSLRTPYSRQMEQALNKFNEMLNKKELINASKKQAEYLALQNQINPHFLYNTLEGIRSEAVVAGMDNVAAMAKALGTFFRYTIAGVNHNVTLEDELNNIENYYIIQQFRFGDKLHLQISYENDTDEMEALSCRIPKLTLQPIVENSIYHGIEPKIGDGYLVIKILTTLHRLIITISDNGLGMEEEKLNELNDKLKSLNLDDVSTDTKKQGGIAVINVNNRIKLLFGEEYGVHIFSMLHVGTDVVITLPLLNREERYEE